MSSTPSFLKRTVFSTLLACTLLPTAHAAVWVPEGQAHTPTDTPEEQNAKMGWWRDARFGMFIHWGLYSVAAGEWKGKQIGSIGEWIQKNAAIPIEEYKTLATQFNPQQFNADEWVAIAKKAGMKYIIITAKHHEGFAMFRSKVDPFNIYDATSFKRDPLAELAIACRKADMRFGFYYSHDQDWTAPGGAVIGKMWDKAQEGSFADYIHKKSLPQFKELLNNYQPFPDVIWFDTPTTDMTPELAMEFIDLIKQHPKLIWNERLGGGFKGNYRTPENHIPDAGMKGIDGKPEDWEVCMTMNNTWGFKKNDNAWKSAQTLVWNLTDIASKGGNLLLNVGPTAEGVIPAPSVERLAEVGRWMSVNGESIYGTTASPFAKHPSWGRVTRKGNTLYLHVFKWPKDGRLLLPIANPAQARLLAAPSTRVATANTDRGLMLALPATAPDAISSVIAITLKEEPQLMPEPSILQDSDKSVTLSADAAEIVGNKLKLESGKEPNLGYWSDAAAYVQWKITVKQPGTFKPALTYSCNDKDAGSEFTLSVGDQDVKGKVIDTGGWQNYKSASLNELRISKPGDYTVTLKITKKGSGNVMNLRSLVLNP